MPQFNENVRFRKGLRGPGWATPEYYGKVDRTGAVDATTVIQTALSDIGSSDGGGTVSLLPGVYRHTGLHLPDKVALRGAPGSATFLLRNHATNGDITLDGGATGRLANVVTDIQFIGNIAGTGAGVAPGVARAIFRRCSWNLTSANLHGPIAQLNSALWANLNFIDCEAILGADVNGFQNDFGTLSIVRGRIVMPAAYTSSLVIVDNSSRAIISGTRLDCIANATGPSNGLYVASATARGAMYNCEIDATGSTGGSVYALNWAAGASVFSKGHTFLGGNIIPYAGSSTPAVGSDLELLPLITLLFGAISTKDLRPYSNYRIIQIKATSATNVALTMPIGLFPGQKLSLVYCLDPAATPSTTPSFVTTPVTATAVPSFGAGDTLTGDFIWESPAQDGNYRWIQQGTWGIGVVLV